MAILLLLNIRYLPVLLTELQAANELGSVTIPNLAPNETQTTFIQNMGKTDRAH